VGKQAMAKDTRIPESTELIPFGVAGSPS
jgi:hypothetical protein